MSPHRRHGRPAAARARVALQSLRVTHQRLGAGEARPGGAARKRGADTARREHGRHLTTDVIAQNDDRLTSSFML